MTAAAQDENAQRIAEAKAAIAKVRDLVCSWDTLESKGVVANAAMELAELVESWLPTE